MPSISTEVALELVIRAAVIRPLLRVHLARSRLGRVTSTHATTAAPGWGAAAVVADMVRARI